MYDIFSTKDAAVILAERIGATRKRVYKPFRSKKRKGVCQKIRTIEVRSKATDEVYYVAKSKGEAIREAKKLIAVKKEDLYGKTVYVSNDIDFVLEYGAGVQPWLFHVFIVDDEDIIQYTREKRRVYARLCESR